VVGHGGRIIASGQPNKGALFSIDIPVHQPRPAV